MQLLVALSILSLLMYPISSSAKDVTLYGRPAEITGGLYVDYSNDISPISVDSNGVTYYVGTQVITRVVFQEPSFTRTVISEPTTDVFTFRADASRYYQEFATTVSSGPNLVIHTSKENCLFNADPNANITCVFERAAQPLVDGTAGEVEIRTANTYIGPAAPFYTISNVETFKIPRPTSGPGSLDESGDSVEDGPGDPGSARLLRSFDRPSVALGIMAAAVLTFA